MKSLSYKLTDQKIKYHIAYCSIFLHITENCGSKYGKAVNTFKRINKTYKNAMYLGIA